MLDEIEEKKRLSSDKWSHFSHYLLRTLFLLRSVDDKLPTPFPLSFSLTFLPFKIHFYILILHVQIGLSGLFIARHFVLES